MMDGWKSGIVNWNWMNLWNQWWYPVLIIRYLENILKLCGLSHLILPMSPACFNSCIHSSFVLDLLRLPQTDHNLMPALYLLPCVRVIQCSCPHIPLHPSHLTGCCRGFPTFPWLSSLCSVLPSSLSPCHLSYKLPLLCRMLLNIFYMCPLLFYASYSVLSSHCSLLSVSLWSAHRML